MLLRPMYVASLGSGTLDVTRFGGKAATLDRLAAHHRVPAGFAIAADASDDHVRALVPGAYAELGRAVAVAVRSSAIGEDSRGASFAGQHDTILNVRGADAVVDAVLAVRGSATSERAAAYRREKGINDVPRVAVLVQRMVEASASVIAFTADPVTADDDLVVVNACRGLGDAMASGEVTPDMYQVRKSDLEVIFANATLDGAALTHPQVQAVAHLALSLERDHGHPVDIEAAFEHDLLYLLQSRPISAAGERDDDFPIVWPQPGDESITWEREDAHFSGASLPLSVDYAREGPATGLQRREERLAIPLRTRFEEFNGFVYVGAQAKGDPMAALHASLPKRRVAARQLVADWPVRHLPETQEHFAWMRELRPLELDADAAAEAWLEVWRRHNRVWEIHMTVTGGSYALMDELAETYARLTGRPAAEAYTLTQGRATTLQRMQRALYVLVETVRALVSVTQAISGGVESPGVLTDLPGGDRFRAALERFLDEFGNAGQPNEDLSAPAWADDPPALVREVRRALEVPPADPDVRLATLLADGDVTLARARKILHDRPDDRARLDEVVTVARAVGPLTEEHNYWIDRWSQAHMRRAALAFARRLLADGSFERAEDVFHLYFGEVADALRRPRDLRSLIAERRARHARNVRLRPPEIIGKPPDAPRPGAPPAWKGLDWKVPQDDPSVLKGEPACAGVVRGPARLVRGPQDLAKVRAGDVLVCRSSNVSYVPVYGKVAAVVTEVGGPLSHAAVVAREFGVPCVVATSVALSVLRDGEVVEVDGGAGIVRRIAVRAEVVA